MSDIGIELHEEVAVLRTDDSSLGVPPGHPELARPSDDAALDRRLTQLGPAQDRQRAPVELPLREHEVESREQRRALLGGLRHQPLRPPDELRARLRAFPQHVVDDDERAEGGERGVGARRDCDDHRGHVCAGVYLVKVEMQVGHLLFRCSVFIAGCRGYDAKEDEGEKKKQGKGVGHGEGYGRQSTSG
ncbi:unnamed protein product, partial [Musa acuminata var. zebrina]